MPSLPQTGARSLPVIPSCNRAWRSNPPARTVRSFRKFLAGTPALTCTPLPCRMYTRIYLAKAVTLAKGFMMSRLSSAVWQVRCARIPCSATTCLKGFMDARRWSRISSCMRNIHPATWCMPAACAGGFAAIGSYCPGYFPSSTPKTGWLPTGCPPSINGKYSTTCGAAFYRPCWWRCLRRAGCSCPAHPGSGLYWCCCLPPCPLRCKLCNRAGTILGG